MRSPRIVFRAVIISLLLCLPAAAGEMVVLRIQTVLATNTPHEVDRRLERIRGHLDRLFHFPSYRLVKGERRVTRLGSTASFDLPGGRFLEVLPKSHTGNRISMRVMMIEGDRPIVNTEVVLQNGGVFFVGGRRHNEGVLITSIGVAADN
jgi:hypothetical protein